MATNEDSDTLTEENVRSIIRDEINNEKATGGRRDFLQALGLGGLAAGMGGGAGYAARSAVEPASAQSTSDSVGDVGTPSDPVDVFAAGISADELSSKEFDNVHHAINYSGTTGRDKIQNALDAANSQSGNNAVVVGPVGPDSNGEWHFSQPVQLHTDSTLILKNPYFRAQDTISAFRNADLSNGNANITIVSEGAIIDGNMSNLSEPSGKDPSQNTLRFYKTDNLSIEGRLKIRETVDWAARIEDADDLFVDHLHFEQNGQASNQDGLKCIGPMNNPTVNTITGKTTDDPISFAGDDDRDRMDGTGGDITHVNIGTVNTLGTGRVLLMTGGGIILKHVNIESIKSDTDGPAFHIGASNWGGTPAASDLEHVNVGQINVSGGQRAVEIEEPCQKVTIEQITGVVASNVVEIRDSTDVYRLTINSGDVTRATSGGGGITVKSGSTLHDSQVANFQFDNFNYIFNTEDTSGAQNCWANDIKGYNITYPYGRLSNWELGDQVPPVENGKGTFTHTGGSSTSVTLQNLAMNGHLTAKPEPIFWVESRNFSSTNYGYDISVEAIRLRDDLSSDPWEIDLALTWTTDPGTDNDVTFGYRVVPKNG